MRSEFDMDAQVTIGDLVAWFDGTVTYRAIDQWVRRGLLPVYGRDPRGRLLVRFGDALEAEARTARNTRGKARVLALAG